MAVLAIDLLWLFFNGVFVFFMQCGFGMLEAGSVRRKNVKNILIKNITDVCVGALAFWLFGFGLAFGGDGEFIGQDHYFGGECLDNKYNDRSCGKGYVDWFFQFAFAATSATIVSGAVAERACFSFYLLYATVLTSFVYPVVVHWIWGGGWLGVEGVNDFAGGCVVHMTGGMAGLVGAIVLGPRIDRFKGDKFSVVVKDFNPNSFVFRGLGVFILWTGWYGFNVGSTLAITNNEEIAELVVINTTLAPAACGLVCLLGPSLVNFVKGKVEIPAEPLLNGVLTGLVAITPGCNVMDPGLAFFTGFLAGFIYLCASSFLKEMKVDDPLDAVAVHYFGGLWGMLATGLFTKEEFATSAGHGLLTGGDGNLLKWQLIACVCVSLWAGGLCFLLFVPVKMLGFARVSEEVEKMGLDEHHHGGMEGSKSRRDSCDPLSLG